MLADLFRRGQAAPHRRALQVTPWGDWGTSFPSAAGVTVSPESSLQLLAVYGCVSLIADTIATLPLDVYRDAGTGRSEQPKPRWLEQPNPSTDIIDFWTQTLTSLLLDGNAYWAYATDRNFTPTEVHVLAPASVQIRDDGDGPVYLVGGRPFVGKLRHIRGITRPGEMKGVSPVEAARQSIGVGLAAQEFAGSFYRNGTTVSGVLEVPGDLTDEGARQLKESWLRAHAGASNANLPAVVTGGAQWKPMAVTPEQAQFLETRGYQAAEICSQLFLVDPSWFGLAIGKSTSITYQNLEQRGAHLAQFTLMRWLIRLERAASSLLPKNWYAKFNVNALQRADLKTRFDAYAIGLNGAPFLELDEVRGWEDLPLTMTPAASPLGDAPMEGQP